MTVLVIGGSGSGKSAYAEAAADALWKEEVERSTAAGKVLREKEIVEGILAEREGIQTEKNVKSRKYYVATMQIMDAESQEKVERHRRLRRGKGFFTIEQPVKIQEAATKMQAGGRIVLLECISNLVANEMFSGGQIGTEERVTEKIMEGIAALNKETTHLIIVSNNVFEDGIYYDESTMAYIRAMGEINRRLAGLADRVVEIVVGIPVVLKESRENF